MAVSKRWLLFGKDLGKMKITRRIILFFLAIALLALTACGSSDTPIHTDAAASSIETSATRNAEVSPPPTAEVTVPATTEAVTPPTTEAASLPAESTSQDYILNNNTMKFHFPSCDSADKIKPENKSSFHGTRDELIAKGYSSCGNCHP